MAKQGDGGRDVRKACGGSLSGRVASVLSSPNWRRSGLLSPVCEADGSQTSSWSAIGREWNEQHAGSAWTYSKPADIKRTYLGVRRRIINAEYQITGSPRLLPSARW